MKKIFITVLAVVLVLGVSLPMASIVVAAPASMTVVSDNITGDGADTVITRVHNMALGTNTVVDLVPPINAVTAWEPDPYETTYPTEPPEATDSTWDNGVNWFEDNGSSADWIWETHRAEDPALLDSGDPRYDEDAARYGRIVLFETTFNIPGIPTKDGATLHIAADNGWEAWVNSGTHHLSSTVNGTGWEYGDLHETNLNSQGWQTVTHQSINALELVNGPNTLYVLAGNEYFWNDPGETNNSNVPPTQSNPYKQYNPGAVIFQLDIQYEEFVPEPGLTIDKTTDWTGNATIGDNINYYYSVNNTGNVILDNLIVEDDKAGTASPVVDDGYNVGDDNKDGNFDPGEIWKFEASYTVVEDDLEHCTLVNVATATAYYEGEPYFATDSESIPLAKIIILCAGRDKPVGTVTVVNNSGELTVTYQTYEPWLMTEIHLHVSEDKDGDGIADRNEIPQTRKCNPIPGKFRENVKLCPPKNFWQVTYNLEDEGWEPCETDLVIAAHAVVVKCPDPNCDMQTDFKPYLSKFYGHKFLPYLMYKLMSGCHCIEEETAWAGGKCDTKPNVKPFCCDNWEDCDKCNKKPNVNPFCGKNWATYFTYHVMLCGE